MPLWFWILVLIIGGFVMFWLVGQWGYKASRNNFLRQIQPRRAMVSAFVERAQEEAAEGQRDSSVFAVYE